MNSTINMFSSTTAYLNKNIRWNIQSFINDSDIWKSKFDNVVHELFWKMKFSNEVIIGFKKGARLVAEDEFGPCVNCYHNGDHKEFGFGDGLCIIHTPEDFLIWIDFEEFSKISHLGSKYETYEEYEIERIAKQLRDKYRADEYNKMMSNIGLAWD
jgi:hypothetical protein